MHGILTWVIHQPQVIIMVLVPWHTSAGTDRLARWDTGGAAHSRGGEVEAYFSYLVFLQGHGKNLA